MGQGNLTAPDDIDKRTIRVAQYVRMSTDHQKYSTENQADVIRAYADANGFLIVRTYVDAGKSGLSLEGREALQRLLDDVQSGSADFSAVLVYDVSRWGRFQDADESAFHEYVCKRAGVSLHFCAEQFRNDGGLAATMIKGMKRVMAGEYSRELSVKVFLGQCRLIELGYRQGGVAGYGLRRRLLDHQDNVKAELVRGEQKSIQTDRVILVPGPDHEVDVVRRIYRMFVREAMTESTIAARLNEEGVSTGWGRSWSASVIHGILTNHKYVGENVFNRRSSKLRQRRVTNAEAMWVKAPAAFASLVEREDFDRAKLIIASRGRKIPDDEMLGLLGDLLQDRGGLSAVIIDEAGGLPSSAVYRKRFGSLARAFRLAGMTRFRDDGYVEVNRALRAMHPGIVARAIADMERAGAKVTTVRHVGRQLVNGEFSINLIIVRCGATDAGTLRWIVRFDPGRRSDLTVAVRMAEGNKSIKDYYLLPKLDGPGPSLRLREENGIFVDAFRFDSLDYLVAMTARVPFRRAA